MAKKIIGAILEAAGLATVEGAIDAAVEGDGKIEIHIPTQNQTTVVYKDDSTTAIWYLMGIIGMGVIFMGCGFICVLGRKSLARPFSEPQEPQEFELSQP